MKMTPEIIFKFVSGLLLLLSGIGLLTVDDVEKLTALVDKVVPSVFTIVGALGIGRTWFKAKRHQMSEGTGDGSPK